MDKNQRPTQSATHNEERQILSVSRLTKSARHLLEQHFASVWIEGEISNFSRPRSGHWYFTLKDDNAQVRCAMFANRNRSVATPITEGMNLLVRGRVSLYEGRGDFQVIVDHIEPAGEGALRAAFEALKIKLSAEGLFAEERKRSLPALPSRLALVSSRTGAALRDVLNVIGRRYPLVQVTLLPVAVQGPSAEPQLLAALQQIEVQLAADPAIFDAVLVTRGGGSLEDLWAFNLESVARAVARCSVPLVSAIGHQTDFAITDFVADVRAATPSAAAELLTPSADAMSAALAQQQARLVQTLAQNLRWLRQQLHGLRRQLVDPKDKLQQQQQQVDQLDQRLLRSLNTQRTSHDVDLKNLQHRLLRLHPKHSVERARGQISQVQERMRKATASNLQHMGLNLQAHARTLNAISPLNTLTRGFAVVTVQGQAIDSVSGLPPGTSTKVYLEDGAFSATVAAQHPGDRLIENDKNTPTDSSTDSSTDTA